MTRVFAIANQKGGVAKTTTTITLAHAFALRQKPTLVIDFDPQGQSATALGINPEPGVFNCLVSPATPKQYWVRTCERELLSILPGDRSTATAQIVLNAENRPIEAIAVALKSLVQPYDYVFLDTAPSVGGIQERAIWMADYVIIPVATEYLSVDSLGKTLETLQQLVQRGWKGKLLGILPTFYDQITKESRNAMEYLKKEFSTQVLAPIHRATILRECAADGQTIWEKAPNSQAGQDYDNLVKIVGKVS